MSGTGKLEHDEEDGDGGRNLRKDLGSPGQRLSVSDMHQVLTAHKNKAPARDGIASKIATRIESAMKLVQRLVTKNNASRVMSVREDMRASRYHRVNSTARGSTQSDATTSLAGDARAEVEMYRRNWKTAYASWKNRLSGAKNQDGHSLAPYAEQWRLMDTVHRRCVLEAKEERQGRIKRTAEEPACIFGHGLPGSGKTQVMKYLSEYF